MNNLKLILAETLYIGDGSKPLCDQAVVVDGQHIADVVPFSEAPQAETIIETEILAPGFIDLQLNGAGGKQFNDEPSVETLVCMAQAAQIGGTAWFFPTFITDYERNFETAIKSAEAAQDECIGVVGLHLEGPFLSPHRPGIHPADAIRPIDDADEDVIANATIPILLTFGRPPGRCSAAFAMRPFVQSAAFFRLKRRSADFSDLRRKCDNVRSSLRQLQYGALRRRWCRSHPPHPHSVSSCTVQRKAAFKQTTRQS